MKHTTGNTAKQTYREMKSATNPVTKWVLRCILIKRFERGEV